MVAPHHATRPMEQTTLGPPGNPAPRFRSRSAGPAPRPGLQRPPQTGPAPPRLRRSTLFASNALLKLVQRRLVSEDSRHFRSLAELRRLQKERTAVEPPAQQKEKAPVTENWVRSVKPPAAPAAFPPSPSQSGAGASAGQSQAAPNVPADRTALAS